MRFNFEATGIGSVPFKDPAESCRVIYDNFREIPFWPQLPKRSFLENMYAQFSETLPGLVLDEARRTIHIDTSRVAQDIELVYGKYLDSDLEFFKIKEDYAQGLYSFLKTFPADNGNVKYVKGHITGPVSYGLFLTDQNKRSVIYDKDLFEVLTKVLCMKARWQIRKLKKVFPSVIIFVDEPYLVSIGSSYVNVDMKAAFEKLDELAKTIKSEGALVGMHCCGNTDWGELLKMDIDIVNFDAYNFSKEFLLYSNEIKNFLGRGSAIAWGVVPSSEEIEKLTPDLLRSRLESEISALAGKGVDKAAISSLVTPSCGLGSLGETGARKIFENTKKLSKLLQVKR